MQSSVLSEVHTSSSSSSRYSASPCLQVWVTRVSHTFLWPPPPAFSMLSRPAMPYAPRPGFVVYGIECPPDHPQSAQTVLGQLRVRSELTRQLGTCSRARG